jgi:hypothetical protein
MRSLVTPPASGSRSPAADRIVHLVPDAPRSTEHNDLLMQPDAGRAVVMRLNSRWQVLGEPIERLAVGHPSAKARELTDEVISWMQRAPLSTTAEN